MERTASRVRSYSARIEVKISSASFLSGTRSTYRAEISISAFNKDISVLFSKVLKNDQPSYISFNKGRSENEASPLPRLYQPGKLKRLCIHEKTHGIARISFTAPDFAREAGREPICSCLISSNGVAHCQKSTKPGVS